MRITIKRVVTTALVIAFCVGAVLPAFANTNDPTPRIRIDGEFVHIPSHDQSPVIIDGRTLVPVRAVMEALGFDVVWLGHITECVAGIPLQGVVELSKRTDNGGSVRISIGIGHQHIIVTTTNVQRIELDVPAKIINGRTMVPVRAIAELTGYTVTWDRDNFIVDIFTDGRATEQATQPQAPQQPSTQPQQTVALEELEQLVRDGLTVRQICQQLPDAHVEDILILMECEVVRLVNEIRREHGLNELIIHPDLARSARSMAQSLERHGGTLSHTCPTTGLGHREHARQYAPELTWVSENLARVGTSPQSAVSTWIASTRGHRENVLRTPATYIGVGVELVAEEGVSAATWVLRVGN